MRSLPGIVALVRDDGATCDALMYTNCPVAGDACRRPCYSLQMLDRSRDDPRKLVSIEDIARLLDAAPEVIGALALAGELEYRYVRKRVMIFEDSVAAYQDRNPIIPKGATQEHGQKEKPRQY